ncbi:hypothetical protein NC653_030083 [Populus alba x Populus x berolinensis]|uniref:Uncharacterized protein n=1 Tax=Populus alba x Populus x berolinensis TaxID=444605 RepID=A0AAD6LVJ2_9ROSI|nr:hypothetical protein NC653_030083 [Populus alba x Populus x berolinensis]
MTRFALHKDYMSKRILHLPISSNRQEVLSDDMCRSIHSGNQGQVLQKHTLADTCTPTLDILLLHIFHLSKSKLHGTRINANPNILTSIIPEVPP